MTSGCVVGGGGGVFIVLVRVLGILSFVVGVRAVVMTTFLNLTHGT